MSNKIKKSKRKKIDKNTKNSKSQDVKTSFPIPFVVSEFEEETFDKPNTSDFISNRIDVLRKGICSYACSDFDDLLSEDELSDDEAISIASKIFTSEITGDAYCWISNKKMLWKGMGLNKEDFALKYARCSVGEFDKRIRRAQDAINHFGSWKYIGTFNKSTMDAIHKASLDFPDIPKVKSQLLDAASQKLILNHDVNITADWVNKKSSKLFSNSTDKKNKKKDTKSSTNPESDTSSNSDAPEENASESQREEPEDNTDYPSDTKGTDQKVASPLSKNKALGSNVIRNLLKKKIKNFSQGRRKDKKQAAKMVAFLQRYIKRFEKLSGKKS
ncbi:MAG TPA: hypothetical protein DEO86_15740 [Colwellia sp.]|nr:hypothetical protein [Colwellia sp.]|tara:strand:- start:6776 stop:7765 length:990 start_codon:yes stop_codon:yes gene_type:complete